MKGRFSASVLRRDSFPHCASLPSKTSPATMTGSSVTGRCVTPKFVSPWHRVPNNINIRWRREWPHWVGVQVGGCVIREYSSLPGQHNRLVAPSVGKKKKRIIKPPFEMQCQRVGGMRCRRGTGRTGRPLRKCREPVCFERTAQNNGI